jgi:hypothetical protein
MSGGGGRLAKGTYHIKKLETFYFLAKEFRKRSNSKTCFEEKFPTIQGIFPFKLILSF